MNFHTLNLWAILAAAASAFMLGALWYSPAVFGAAWKRANCLDGDDTPKAGGKVFAIAFLLSLVMAFNLAMFLTEPKTNLAWGATAGFLAGFGWVAMGIGIISLFEERPWTYVLVNGGYLTIALVIMGAILGDWR
jgi:membrane-associated HD superfamily phosphohydrolase